MDSVAGIRLLLVESIEAEARLFSTAMPFAGFAVVLAVTVLARGRLAGAGTF